MAKKKVEKPQSKTAAEPVVKPVAEVVVPKEDITKPWYAQAKNHFIAAAVACFLGIMLISSQTGINADDRYHVPYTKYFVDYFTSFGKDTMYRQIPLDEFWKARVMFDMVNYGVAHGILGFEPGSPRKIGDKYPPFVYADEGYHVVRHYLIGIVAFIGLLFSGLIGVKFKGWHFGAIVMGLMMLSPTFIGHAGMNPRDIPFFAWSMIAIYFMVIFVMDFPVVKWSSVLGIALGVALALNVRNGGFLIFAYFGLFAVCVWAYHLFILKDKKVNTIDLFIKGCASFAIAYVAGLIFWPYGQIDPVNIPIFVDLLSSQKYPITLRQLFEGTLVSSGDLPWYYQTKLLIITAPILVLVGFASFAALIFFYRKKVDWKILLVVLFCAFFPIVYIIKVDANVHTGWRHVIFCYPFLMMLTAMGWEFLRDLHSASRYKIGIYAFMLILSIEPILYTIGNLPHLYVYFNPLVGGNKGAWGDYEYDYWSVSLTEGGRWLKKNVVDKSSPKDTILVTSNMWDSFGPLLKKELQSKNVKEVGTKIYTRSREDWDYALYYAAFLEPELLKNPNYWPLKGTVKVIDAAGAPIGIVVKRDPEKNDYKGFKALEAKNFPLAIELFKKSLAYDAYNEDIYRALGEAYLNLGMVNEGVQQFRTALSISPNDRTTVGQLGNIYMSLNQFNDVINLYGPWSESKDPNQQIQALQEIGKAYQAAGDINNANVYFQRAQEAYNAYIEKEGGAQ